MGRNKGICAICGVGGKLTFEHMPPQCAFNEKGVVIHTFEQFERAGYEFEKMEGGYPQPEGTGRIALCNSCNNLTGQWYVPTFCKWVATAAGLLNQIPSLREADKSLGRMVGVDLHKTRPLALIKQIVTILLTLNGEQDEEFSKKHPDLVSFALDRDQTGLPSRYQFYLVLYAGPIVRFVPVAGNGREGGTVTWLTALDHPPLACVMTIDEKESFLPLGKVTEFVDVPYDEERDVRLEMIVGFGHTAFPGDYRSTARIEHDRAHGITDRVHHMEKPGGKER